MTRSQALTALRQSPWSNLTTVLFATVFTQNSRNSEMVRYTLHWKTMSDHQQHGRWTPFRRNGVRSDLCDWFASDFATGSQRWRGWDQSSAEKMVILTYHRLMYVTISPWNIIEFCRIFRWNIATKKPQTVTFEVKHLRTNEEIKKIRILTKIDDSGWRVVSEWFPISSA